jgi:exopolysaccharide biosynthesis polyprenyl glycosylphosphotransferase
MSVSANTLSMRTRTEVAAVPARVVTTARPAPSVLRWVDRLHRAARDVDVVVADLLVLLAVGFASRVPGTAVGAMAVSVIVAFYIAGVYARRCALETQGVLWYPARIAVPFSLVALGYAAGSSLVATSPAETLAYATGAFAALLGVRAATWTAISAARRAGIGLRPTLVVGQGAVAEAVVAKLRAYPEAGLVPVGTVSPDGRRDPGWGLGTGALPNDLPALIRVGRVAHVVLAPEGNDDVGVADSIELCDGLDVDFSILPPLAHLFLHPGLSTQVGGLPLIALGAPTRTRSTLPGKRAFDLVVALVCLVVAAPVMLATAVAVKLGDRGPLFYRQRRVGQGGEPFEMLKFRSMVVDAERLLIDLRDANVTDGLLFKMVDDPRVTKVGAIIRRFSIDELPQLWNVVRGDMSIVGPRPLPVDPDEFGALDGKRHSVPPGITGYWQIAGGTGLSYAEMVKLDLTYIQNWSLWLDLRLLARTIPAVFHRHRYGPC